MGISSPGNEGQGLGHVGFHSLWSRLTIADTRNHLVRFPLNLSSTNIGGKR